MMEFKIGQRVKFTEEELANYKDDITPYARFVRELSKQRMIVTDIDEIGFVQINNEWMFNPDMLEVVK